jgi:transcription elongation factor Elf1
MISRERAERIAKSHACEQCGEYSYKRLVVKPPPASHSDLSEAWHAIKICGVCGLEQEMGIAPDGEIIYVS